MSLGIWQIALIILLFLLLFGRGKIPQLMSDMAQGIKSFKQGINDDAEGAGSAETTTDAKPLDHDRSEEPSSSADSAPAIKEADPRAADSKRTG